jgi:fumarate reductase subunit C
MEDHNLNVTKGVKKLVILVLVVLVPILVFYFVWFIGINDKSLSSNVSDWGAFGDFIGGIFNPLIALIAMILLSISIYIQKTELAAATKAFQDSSKAQKEQAASAQKAAVIQAKNLQLQQKILAQQIESAEMTAVQQIHSNDHQETNLAQQAELARKSHILIQLKSSIESINIDLEAETNLRNSYININEHTAMDHRTGTNEFRGELVIECDKRISKLFEERSEKLQSLSNYIYE